MIDSRQEPGERELSLDVNHDPSGTTINYVERKPFAVRLRMIIALSLICWAVLIGVFVLIFD